MNKLVKSPPVSATLSPDLLEKMDAYRRAVDRPGTDPDDREQGRSCQNSIYRVVQIRQHARTEYPETVLFRVRNRFRHIAFGIPSIGGRYSVLSDFGLVPAAAMGLDVGELLGTTEMMVRSCAADVPAADNPGPQGRPEHRRIPTDHLRGRDRSATTPVAP